MSNTEAFKAVKDVLPHREPFLFLDEILELTDETVRARRTVRPDEPQFEGHYPGRPIMPGVLLCETVLQAGAYLMATRMGKGADMQGAPVVTRMNAVKFRRMVKPGDLLEIYAEHKRSMMGAHMLSGSIKCEGKLVCSLEFSVMLVEDGIPAT
jgi:3-hydroxyacyl-[acyl-carrier-protein] dehydratase